MDEGRGSCTNVILVDPCVLSHDPPQSSESRQTNPSGDYTHSTPNVKERMLFSLPVLRPFRVHRGDRTLKTEVDVTTDTQHTLRALRDRESRVATAPTRLYYNHHYHYF